MEIRKLLLVAFMISGMTALIYEVVWGRPLQLIFGSTIYAVSTILTAFFMGFALGAYLFRNLADKAKNPERLFAFLELGIGLYGLIILWLFKIMPLIYLSLTEIPGIQFAQFFILFLILIIPTTLFGATWPVVNKIYIDSGKLGKDAGKLYSFNSFGAFLGSMAAGFILIPVLGIKVTSLLVASINILVAISIFVIIKNKKGVKNEP
ncbi:MAG: fused MFS/spermidine synthase [Nanoarchaeota archaeon]